MDMEHLLTAMVTIVASVGASSGFWAFFSKRDTQKSATIKLLMGLAHDRIVYLGMQYIAKGSISKDEYEDLQHYLYAPYSEFGGNGLAEKVMHEVSKLPMRGSRLPTPIVEVREERND